MPFNNFRRQANFPYDALGAGGSAVRSVQPDEAQYAGRQAQMRGNMVELGQVIQLLDNQNLPPQLRQTPYIATLANANDVQLLLPANPNRMSFVIAYMDSELNDGAFLFLSYGSPPFPQVGIPLLSATPYAEGNGTVSIDDIYIAGSGTLGGDITNYPATIVAYEGVLAVESHLHRNTTNAAR